MQTQLQTEMQTVTYTVELPKIGDTVRISDIPDTYIIYGIESVSPPYDSILVQNVVTDSLSRIVITNGRWQIQYYSIPHTVTLINKTPVDGGLKLPEYIVTNTQINNDEVNRVVERPVGQQRNTEGLFPYITLPNGAIYGTGIFHSATEGNFPFRVYAATGNGVVIVFDRPMKNYDKNVRPIEFKDTVEGIYYNNIVPAVGESVLGNYQMDISRRKDGRFVPVRYAKLNNGDNITFNNWSDRRFHPVDPV